MKTTLRIPTEQYAFIEISDLEVQSFDEATEKYNELSAMVKGGSGLAHKEWNEALDRYLTDNNLNESQYAGMSKAQQYVIQEIKKSIKRLNK